MKPDLYVAFEAIDLPVSKVCRQLLKTIESHQGGLTDYYFAEVQEMNGDFNVCGERMNLLGRDDVLAQVD